MTRKVLITGATGLLGRQVVKAFARADWTAVGTGLTRAEPPHIVKLDLLDHAAVERALDEVKPDAVIHCAATRSPTVVASSPSLAHALNTAAPTHLAALTHTRSILLVYISTDYVFAGRPGEAPYATDAPPAPTNLYGEAKAEGERGVLSGNLLEDGDGDGKEDGGNEYWKQTPRAYRARQQGGLSPRVPGAVVLRVPVLYGPGPDTGDDDADRKVQETDDQKGAINSLVDRVWDAARVDEQIRQASSDSVKGGEGQIGGGEGEGEKQLPAKIKMDDWAIRYPTNTEDVGRVLVDICQLYLDTAASSTTTSSSSPGPPLPQILHFSSEDRYTKYRICAMLADILGLPLDGMEAWDPTAEDAAADKGGNGDAVVRPYDCHLDTAVLKGLGIDVSTVDFVGWWRRNLRAFRR